MGIEGAITDGIQIRIVDEQEYFKLRKERILCNMKRYGKDVDIFGNKTCLHLDRTPCMCMTINCQKSYCNTCGSELDPDDISNLARDSIF